MSKKSKVSHPWGWGWSHGWSAGGAVPWVPTDVSGCLLWLDANAITGLSDGDPVGTWSDQSGESNDATQSTTSKKPTYKSDIVNGKPIVRADGTDDYLDISGEVVSGGTNRTVFIVGKADSVGATDQALCLGDADNGNGKPFAVTTEYAVRIEGGNRIWDTAASTTAFEIACIVLNGDSTNDLAAYVNGTALGLTSTADLAIDTEGDSSVFCSLDAGPAHYYDGDIAEVIVYNSALSDADRGLVDSYLGTKYEIAVT